MTSLPVLIAVLVTLAALMAALSFLADHYEGTRWERPLWFAAAAFAVAWFSLLLMAADVPS